MRLRLDLAYDGTDFAGWAAQPGQRTVQGCLTEALEIALRGSGPARLTCAGRTDAGVHARGQVAHVDIESDRLPGPSVESLQQRVERLQFSLNGLLARDIAVRGMAVAEPGFDARFAALSRVYSYRVVDHPGAVDPSLRHQTLVVRRRLAVGMMNEAALALLGLHDFSAFCRQSANRSLARTAVRTLLGCSARRGSDGAVVFWVEADAFCHSMVRSLVGALLPVGQGKRPVTWPQALLEAGARDPHLRVMPARGLVLEAVRYPDSGAYAQRVARTRGRRLDVCDEPPPLTVPHRDG